MMLNVYLLLWRQSSGLVYSYGNRPEASSSSAEPGFLSAAEQEQLLLTAGLSYDAVFHQSTDRQGFAVPTVTLVNFST